MVRLYSTLIIGFRSQLNRRSKTGFSRDYTFRENGSDSIPELDRRNLHRRAGNPEIVVEISRRSTLGFWDDDGEFKLKNQGGCPKFTALRGAAAEANARTSAETEKSLPRSPMRLFAQRALPSTKLCFSLGYRKSMTNIKKLCHFLLLETWSDWYWYLLISFSCYVSFNWKKTIIET